MGADVAETSTVVQGAMRRLGLRVHDLDHAVRLQNGDDLTQVARGVLEPGGQLLVTLKLGEQGATKDDLAELRTQLNRIEAMLATEHT